MDKNLQFIKDFVEGKISILNLKDELNSNDKFKQYLEQPHIDDLTLLLQNIGTYDIFKQEKIHTILCRHLNRLNIAFIPTDIYLKKCQKYYEVIPEWLPDSAADWVEENLLNKVPEDLSDAQKKKWIKAEIEKIYPCEKRHPSWVQGTEDWPKDENGNNLTFVKQREKGEQVTYTFVNPKTKETVDIVEFY